MAEQSVRFSINGYPVVIANPAEYPSASSKANGLVCPLGPMAGRCWLLVSRRILTAIDTSGPVAVTIATNGDNSREVTFPNLRFVKALSASGGVPTQNEAVYLVELADVRYFLEWAPVNSQYNVRSADTYDGSDDTTRYYSETLDGSSLWTWARLCEDLWDKLPSIAGAFPGLPYTPHGNPDGLRFIGVSAWDELNGILEKIDCAVAYDPVADTFAIIRTGATQAGLSSIESRYLYLDDAAPIEAISAKMVETVRVFFHKQRVNYATEIETPRTGNVSQDMAHYEDVATGQSSVAGTMHAIWDDLPALIEFDGTITNATDLTDRAAEVAENWIGEQMMSRSRRLYSGLASEFRCGSEVKAFAWRDYGDGLVTEVVKHPGLPKYYDDSGRLKWTDNENLSPPDLARRSFPLFPKIMQVVKVTGTGGTNISPSTGLWPAKVQNWSVQDSAWHDGENVWLKITDYTPPSTLVGGDRYPARLTGSHSNDGDSRPLYTAHGSGAGNPLIPFYLNAALSRGGSASANIEVWDSGSSTWGPTGDAITVYDDFRIGPAISHDMGWCVFNQDSSRYEVVSLPSSGGTQLVLFTAEEHIDIGDSGDAVLREWAAGAWNTTGASVTVYDSSRIGPVYFGDFGVAWLNPDSSRYEIITLQDNEPVPFTLYDALTKGGTQDATVLTLDTGTLGGTTIEVDDSWLRLGPGITGARGLALKINGVYYVMVLDKGATGTIEWAKSTSRWVNAPLNGSYVVCQPVTDKDGGTDIVADPITVWLPRPSKMLDPNVPYGKTIAVQLDANGEYVCASDYLDDAIGTVKMWVGDIGDVDEGWREYGPSTDEARFPRSGEPGAIGGQNTHSHGGTEEAPWETDEAIVVIADHPDATSSSVELLITAYTPGTIIAPVTFVPFSENTTIPTSAVGTNIVGTGVIPTSAVLANNGAGIEVFVATHAGGSASVSGTGTIDSGNTGNESGLGFTIADHPGHNHTIATHYQNYAAPAPGGANFADIVDTTTGTSAAQSHTVTNTHHTHPLTGATVTMSGLTVTLPELTHSVVVTEAPHWHTVSMSSLAAHLSIPEHAHTVDLGDIFNNILAYASVPIPPYFPQIFPNPHRHIVHISKHEVEPHKHGIPDTPAADNVPKYFTVHFIERFE